MMKACFDSATLLKQKQNLERQLFFLKNTFFDGIPLMYLTRVSLKNWDFLQPNVLWWRLSLFTEAVSLNLPIMIVHLRVMPQILPRQRAMVVPNNTKKDCEQTFDVPYSSITARAASRSSLELELSPRASRSCLPRALFDAPSWKPLPSNAMCWACEKKRVSITIVGYWVEGGDDELKKRNFNFEENWNSNAHRPLVVVAFR